MRSTAPAHTSARLIAYLLGQKVVFVGEILVNDTPFPVGHEGG